MAIIGNIPYFQTNPCKCDVTYLSQQLGSTWIKIQLRAHRNRGSEASSRGRRSSMGSNSSKPSVGSEPFHGVVACWDAKQGIPCRLTKKFGIFGVNVLSINWGSSLSIVGILMNKPVLYIIMIRVMILMEWQRIWNTVPVEDGGCLSKIFGPTHGSIS